MEYQKLGNTGLIVSRLALGTMYFGSETGDQEAFAIMDAFLEAGGNFIDTANVYAGGKSEETIGRWFAARPREITDQVVLATKGRSRVNPDVNGAGSTRRSLGRWLDTSLKRLGRETVDLYQLHAWDPLTPVEETLFFLDGAVRAGKVQYVGLSNFTGWQLQLMISTAKQMSLQVPVTLQQQYSLLSRENEWEVIPASLHNGIGLLPWSPLAGGFLSGKYQRDSTPPPGTRAGSEKSLYQSTSAEYAASEQNWDTIDAVVRIANQIGKTPAQVALSWLLDQPTVVAPIIGARTVKHLRDNLGAVGLHLDAKAKAELDTISKPSSGGYPYGVFGEGQRSRAIDGSDNLVTLIERKGEPPLGHRK